MSKTFRKDPAKFGKTKYNKTGRLENLKYTKYDPDEDYEENYERIRPKKRSVDTESFTEDSQAGY